MRALAFVCVCLCTFVGIASATCDPVQVSFDLCSSDVYCTQSMYIDENLGSLTVFNFLYDRLLASSNGHQAQIEAGICAINNTDFNALWTTTMSMYRYCSHINQYFDGADNACLCKSDKICKYSTPDTLEFHFSSTDIFMYVLFIGSVGSIVSFTILYRPLVKETKKLTKAHAYVE